MEKDFSLLQRQREITNVIKEATRSSCPRLEADLLLMQVLECSRGYLYAHSESRLTRAQFQKLAGLLDRVLSHEPMAYITGHKYFWKADFLVTKDTLIPRPETESLLQWVVDNFSAAKNLNVLDLGTGSGAIACSIAKDFPSWSVTASDFSLKALNVARRNAKKLKVEVNFLLGSWFEPLLDTNKFDLIMANPPYIAFDDPVYSGAFYEPKKALYSGDGGMADLKHIIYKALRYLNKNGCLLLEHGASQQALVASMLQKNNYKLIASSVDHKQRDRFVVASYDV